MKFTHILLFICGIGCAFGAIRQKRQSYQAVCYDGQVVLDANLRPVSCATCQAPYTCLSGFCCSSMANALVSAFGTTAYLTAACPQNMILQLDNTLRLQQCNLNNPGCSNGAVCLSNVNANANIPLVCCISNPFNVGGQQCDNTTALLDVSGRTNYCDITRPCPTSYMCYNSMCCPSDQMSQNIIIQTPAVIQPQPVVAQPTANCLNPLRSGSSFINCNPVVTNSCGSSSYQCINSFCCQVAQQQQQQIIQNVVQSLKCADGRSPTRTCGGTDDATCGSGSFISTSGQERCSQLIFTNTGTRFYCCRI